MMRRTSRKSGLLAACGILATMAAWGQAPAPEARPVQIKKIIPGKVATPQYQLLKGQTMARTREWFQLVTQYETAPDWMDELTFTNYVLVRDTQKNAQTLFKGDVTYMTVQKGKHMSDIYLHPSTIARYGQIQATAVLVTFRGQLEAVESQPASQQRWWEQMTPTEGFLLSRMDTPFAMMNFDDYEAIKPRWAGGR